MPLEADIALQLPQLTLLSQNLSRLTDSIVDIFRKLKHNRFLIISVIVGWLYLVVQTGRVIVSMSELAKELPPTLAAILRSFISLGIIAVLIIVVLSVCELIVTFLGLPRNFSFLRILARLLGPGMVPEPDIIHSSSKDSRIQDGVSHLSDGPDSTRTSRYHLEGMDSYHQKLLLERHKASFIDGYHHFNPRLVSMFPSFDNQQSTSPNSKDISRYRQVPFTAPQSPGKEGIDPQISDHHHGLTSHQSQYIYTPNPPKDFIAATRDSREESLPSSTCCLSDKWSISVDGKDISPLTPALKEEHHTQTKGQIMKRNVPNKQTGWERGIFGRRKKDKQKDKEIASEKEKDIIMDGQEESISEEIEEERGEKQKKNISISMISKDLILESDGTDEKEMKRWEREIQRESRIGDHEQDKKQDKGKKSVLSRFFTSKNTKKNKRDSSPERFSPSSPPSASSSPTARSSTARSCSGSIPIADGEDTIGYDVEGMSEGFPSFFHSECEPTKSISPSFHRHSSIDHPVLLSSSIKEIEDDIISPESDHSQPIYALKPIRSYHSPSVKGSVKRRGVTHQMSLSPTPTCSSLPISLSPSHLSPSTIPFDKSYQHGQRHCFPQQITYHQDIRFSIHPYSVPSCLYLPNSLVVFYISIFNSLNMIEIDLKSGKTTKTDIRSHMSMPALEPLVLDSILVSTPARSIVYIVCAKKRERKRLMEGAQQGILLFGMHLGSRTWKLVDVSMSFCKKTKQDHKLHPPSSLAYDTKGSLCSSAGMSVDRGCVRVINKKDSPVIVYVDMIERMCIFSRDSGHNWSHKVINSRMLPAFGPLHVVRSNGDKDTGSFLSLQPRGQILKFGNTGLLRWRIRNNSSMLKSKKNDFSSICGAHG
ncbi:hypothetical protein ADUPG1_012673, partial [Aduncisulcus paluster]